MNCCCPSKRRLSLRFKCMPHRCVLSYLGDLHQEEELQWQYQTLFCDLGRSILTRKVLSLLRSHFDLLLPAIQVILSVAAASTPALMLSLRFSRESSCFHLLL